MNMNLKRQINGCLFMSMIFISVQIEFDIEINNDDLLKNIGEHKKLIDIGGGAQKHRARV
jgi:hypothetical protein